MTSEHSNITSELSMNPLRRRDFIGGALASIGLAASGAPSPRKPNLTLGVVSDIHVRVPGWKNQPFDTTQFHNALLWFRELKVDGVVIAGDIADNGQEAPMRGVAEAWLDVFPARSHVKRLFVTGNHDWWGQGSVPKMESTWNKIWKDLKVPDEKYKSVWAKRLKGYVIIGQQWENYQDCANAPFDKVLPVLEKLKGELHSKRPFFYIQHPHLKNTCYRNGGWGRDRGIVTGALSKFPNAIAISGHSHHSLTRKNAFWRGSFTAVPTSSLRYRAQGLVIRAYDDKVTYERLDFNHKRWCANPWESPVTK